MEDLKEKLRKEKFKFSGVLFTANKPTLDGRIYPKEILEKMVERFTKKPSIIIQEMNEVERNLKKIPLAEPWDKRIMADVIKGEIKGNELIFYAECRANKEGKKLEGIIKGIGLENLTFFPVGYGTTSEKNVIHPNYQLNYIAMEPKK